MDPNGVSALALIVALIDYLEVKGDLFQGDKDRIYALAAQIEAGVLAEERSPGSVLSPEDLERAIKTIRRDSFH